jgi:hypothetical protein
MKGNAEIFYLYKKNDMKTITIIILCAMSFFLSAQNTTQKTSKEATAKSVDKFFVGKYDHVSCGDHCSVIFIGDNGKEYDGYAKTEEISGYKLFLNHEINPEYVGKKFKVFYVKEKDPEGGFDHITITKVELLK